MVITSAYLTRYLAAVSLVEEEGGWLVWHRCGQWRVGVSVGDVWIGRTGFGKAGGYIGGFAILS